MNTLGRHIRDGWRQWRRTPAVTLVALLSLGLAVGVNTAIFGLLNALLLKPLAVQRPEQLVTLSDERDISSARMTTATWDELARQQDIFQGIAAYEMTSHDMSRAGEPVRYLDGLYVSGTYFDVLGVRPAIGRLFDTKDDIPGNDARIAVLSHSYWQRAFGGNPDVVGRTVTVSRLPFVVVGVSAEGFFGTEVGRTFQIALPLEAQQLTDPTMGSNRRTTPYWLNAIARLRDGQEVAEAESRLRALQPHVRGASLPTPTSRGHLAREWRLERTMMLDAGARRLYRPAVSILIGVVTLVLLIACVNLANLLLARGAVRRREIAVRLSLGGRRSTLVTQLFVEALMLAAGGAALGALMGGFGSRLVVALLSTETRQMFLDVSPDARIFGFVAMVGVVCAVLFGVAPALKSTRLDPLAVLRESAGIGRGSTRFGLSHVLIGAQVALTFVLVFGAVALVGTFRQLVTQPAGFERNRVLTASVNTRPLALSRDELREWPERLRAEIAQIAGVESAASSLTVPFGSIGFMGYVTRPGAGEPSRDTPQVLYNYVSADYFRTMGIGLVWGAEFDRFERLQRIVVTESLARKFFGTTDAVGRSLELPGRGKGPWEIIGIAPDLTFGSLRNQGPPFIYLPESFNTRGQSLLHFSLRTTRSLASIDRDVVRAAERLLPGATVRVAPLDREAEASIVRERAVAILSASFAALAMLLAAIGLYGVMSYHVTRRRGEIGIRIAIGAAPGRIKRLVLGQVGLLTIGGLAAGVGLALWFGRFLLPLLYAVKPSDPWVLLSAAGILVATAAVAGYLPARRAARIDPMTALRAE